MTGTSINRFLVMWENKTLDADATWRAYDFKPAILERHIQGALKEIGLGYAKEHGTAQFSALYEVPPEQARYLLGAWWLWSRIARGRRMRVPLRMAQEGPNGGSGATTLPGSGPSPA